MLQDCVCQHRWCTAGDTAQAYHLDTAKQCLSAGHAAATQHMTLAVYSTGHNGQRYMHDMAFNLLCIT